MGERSARAHVCMHVCLRVRACIYMRTCMRAYMCYLYACVPVNGNVVDSLSRDLILFTLNANVIHLIIMDEQNER